MPHGSVVLTTHDPDAAVVGADAIYSDGLGPVSDQVDLSVLAAANRLPVAQGVLVTILGHHAGHRFPATAEHR